MKLKTGQEVQVLGEVVIENRECFICKLHVMMIVGVAVPYVVIPKSSFVIDNGIEWINEQPVDSRKIFETPVTKTGEIQAEGHS